MQLLRLEMKGFKSFADKTVVSFSPGMTGIVGPNGSGKSNITDAIRWVLGESNVRHLRGQKAEDIIFSGTEARRPHNTAEVNLIFDNSDGTLGKELAEVVITRRMYRNGESEFQINKRNCRLKDIHLLLADTGLGKDSMAIIGQNRIDAILNSKPEERRLIFEDVAGISRFKMNKEDAIRRINSTDRNMERLDDVMSTLGDQLIELEAKANVTREYNTLSQDKRSYDGAIAFHEYKTADRLFTRQENENLSYLREQEELETSLDAIQETYKTTQNELQSFRETNQSMEDEYATLQGKLGELTGQIEVARLKEANMVEELKDGEERLTTWKEELKEKEEQYDRDLASLKEEENTLEVIGKDVKQAESNLKNTRDSLSQVKANLDGMRVAEQHAHERHIRVVRELEEARHQLARAKELETQKKDDVQRLQATLQDLEQSMTQAKAQLEAQQQVVSEAQEALQTARQSLANIESKRSQANQQLIETQRELQAKEGRLELLHSWEELHEGYLEGTKHVLQAKERWSSHIRGAIGDVFTVEEKFLVAIETALGGAIHQVITDTAKIASEAVQYLKRTQGGRVTFLPMDMVRGKRLDHKALTSPYVLGLGVDCIQFDTQYTGIFNQLLGRTLIVDTLDHGLALQKEYHQQLRIVTLTGEQLQPGGALTGGATKRKKVSILSRKEEQDTLQKDIHTLRDTAQVLQHTLQGLDKEIEALIQSGKGLRQTYEQEELQLRSLQQEQQRSQGEQANLSGMAQTYHEELEKTQEKQTTLGANIKRLADELSQLENREGHQEQVTTLVAQEQTLQDREREQNEELQGVRLRWEQSRLLLEQSKKELSQLEQHIKDKEINITSLDRRLSQLGEDVIRLGGEPALALESEKQAIEKRVAAIGEARKGGQEKVRAWELQLNQLQEERNQKEQRQRIVQKKLVDLQEGLTKYQLQGEQALEQLGALGYTKQEAQNIHLGGSVHEWKRQQANLAKQIESLGAINPNAIAEYEEAEERLAFYDAQKEDLVTAKEQLEGVIAEIDGAMSEQLQGVLTEIREKFQHVFSQLFGGGTAQIVASNPESILESGIDFYIQPPGKKRQQLSLLSGGERALTVIALLFALLDYRPAPFCVLDEVDAALDDANVERFSQYLHNLGDATQFIVVTHRKRTMESAHVLQGVTMVERGVSRLLTVAFDEVKENSDYGI
ncbi:chromosome segregation protein SMC [Veillonella sp. VA139]|uniref:chromosome segregation protein SMC n=1 Tax=Veillonella sp. VA139 TaxID=741830 RepID=UPI000F8C5FF9|nr:chromosome segregation protein SMC [Veillonella sp. VA139]